MPADSVITAAYEEAYEDVYEVVEPYSREFHRWRRHTRLGAWLYAGVGLFDGLVLPWFDLGWWAFALAVVVMVCVLVWQNYCARRAHQADRAMMDKFHEVFRAQLELHTCE